jgi:transcription initiation protein SPT3
MAAVRRTAGEGGSTREFKYSQEISQMVRSVIVYFFLIKYSNPSQMFVFGEVQDPNMDTVNLVEDIVRSQLIELVNIYIYNHLESTFSNPWSNT